MCLNFSHCQIQVGVLPTVDPRPPARPRQADGSSVSRRGRRGCTPDGRGEARLCSAATAASSAHAASPLRPCARSVSLLFPFLSYGVQNVDLLTGGRRSQEAVEEWELTRCIDDVCKVSPDNGIGHTLSHMSFLQPVTGRTGGEGGAVLRVHSPEQTRQEAESGADRKVLGFC